MMPPPPDFTQPAHVRSELLDPDQTLRDQFAHALAPELDTLAAALAVAFAGFAPIADAARPGGRRAMLVAGFAFGVLDDTVVATKLLLSGKGPAAGNTMRQAIEGVAIATLCATDAPLILLTGRNGQPRDTGCYRERMEQRDRLTQGHLALKQLAWNAQTLQVNAHAIERLSAAQQYYHQFSHCGLTTIGLRSSPSNPRVTWLGGQFDAANLKLYRREMQERINLARLLPEFWAYLLEAMTSPGSSTGRPA
ncbi:hypothetical protein [Burkholderia sp. BCC0405]|uniref:hypothetical protein n=1 Tax=Burkholderia sp. BCC0405 TaxID=2676298 RepID=UPI00158A8EE9|nr:hypothetical protein [Burkholderia sp. BCC0405]